MGKLRIYFLIADDLWTKGKKVICTVTVSKADSAGWCDVTFAGRTEPSMKLHEADIKANTV